MKVINGVALAFAIVSTQATAAYSVAFRVGMVEQEAITDSVISKQSDFAYGVEVSELQYVWKNFSLGWSVSADMASTTHDQFGDVETLDIFAGPVISYRIAAISPEFCGCKYRRVHDGISVFVKPQINYWTTDWELNGAADSESDLGLAWSAGLKFQDTSNINFAIEYQSVMREVPLVRADNRTLEFNDDRVVLSFGYRF